MKSWKQFAEWLGVEFNKPFECEHESAKFKITDNGVEFLSIDGTYHIDNVLIKQLIEGTLTVKWVPEKGETYYFPDYKVSSLVYSWEWREDKMDKSVAQNVGIYKTLEEARAKAIELGWRELEEEQ